MQQPPPTTPTSQATARPDTPTPKEATTTPPPTPIPSPTILVLLPDFYVEADSLGYSEVKVNNDGTVVSMSTANVGNKGTLAADAVAGFYSDGALVKEISIRLDPGSSETLNIENFSLVPGLHDLELIVNSETADLNNSNNFGKLTVNVPELADLAVGQENIRFNEVGRNEDFSVTYQVVVPLINFGGREANNVGLRLYSDLDGLVGEKKDLVVNPEDSVAVVLENVTLSPGRNNLKASILYKGAEKDRLNNAYEFVKSVPFPDDKPDYTREEWDYFKEIAFGSDRGPGTLIRKWIDPPIVIAYGSATDPAVQPSEQSMSTLVKVVEELRDLTGLDIKFTERPEDANFSVYIDVSHSDFYRIFPDRASSGEGRSWISKNVGMGTVGILQGVINSATVAIADKKGNTDFSREIINHLIREEVTQALGLFRDSDSHPGSIFTEKWSDDTEYLPIDRRVIELHYQPFVKPNMTFQRIQQFIEIVS